MCEDIRPNYHLERQGVVCMTRVHLGIYVAYEQNGMFIKFANARAHVVLDYY